MKVDVGPLNVVKTNYVETVSINMVGIINKVDPNLKATEATEGLYNKQSVN